MAAPSPGPFGPPPSRPGTPAPFGAGGTGAQGPFVPPSPPGGSGPFGASGAQGPFVPPSPVAGRPGGPVVVHRARLGARLGLVFGVMVVISLVLGGIGWAVALSEHASRPGAERDGGIDRSGPEPVERGPLATDDPVTTPVTDDPVVDDPVTTPGTEGPVTGAGTVDLPVGWPETLAPPAGARVVSAVTTSAGTPEEQFVVVYEVTDAIDAVAATVRAQLVGAGLVIATDSGVPGGPAAFTAAGAGRDAVVSVAPAPARPGVVSVSWVLRAEG